MQNKYTKLKFAFRLKYHLLLFYENAVTTVISFARKYSYDYEEISGTFCY